MCETMTLQDQVTSARLPIGTTTDLPSPFVFVGDALALDLVNTEVVIRGKPIDLLAAPGAYAAWWRQAAGHYPEAAGHLPPGHDQANPDLLPNVMALRDALRALFGATADDAPLPSAALTILNQTLGTAHDAVALGTEGEPHALLVPDGPDADGPLAAVARSAFTLLTRADHSRLHRCANGRCVLLFYDTTKSATRRWCSTACMNRARSSERYRVRKGRASTDAPSPGPTSPLPERGPTTSAGQ
jgi:predicted RNA-binding Zn ribbon-like protein